jgi:hypothetical protein
LHFKPSLKILIDLRASKSGQRKSGKVGNLLSSTGNRRGSSGDYGPKIALQSIAEPSDHFRDLRQDQIAHVFATDFVKAIKNR